ncbi:MAG: FG-GAP-like repeat-containing protein [Gemmatimonadaceae bacterium]
MYRPTPLPAGLVVAGVAALVVSLASCQSETANPHEALAAHYQGLIFLQRGQLPEAEAQFERVTTLAPRDPAGFANLGLTHLRASRFDEAESALRRARRLDENHVEAGLILARLYSVTDRRDDAREVLEELPRDARVVYALAELDAMAGLGDTASLRRYRERLGEVLALSPANLAVRLEVADVQVRRGLADSAVIELAEIRRQRPEPPPEAQPFLDSALTFLRQGQLTQARPRLDRFIELMKLAAPYQAALEQVKWVDGPLVGRPVLAFNPQTLIQTRSMLGAGERAEIRFVDATSESGLAPHGLPRTAIALGDYDGDGAENLFVAGTDASGGAQARTFMYNMRAGYVADVTQRAGISLPAGAVHANFADLDNDGWLDLFVIGTDGAAQLLRNNRSGAFETVSAAAGMTDLLGVRKSLFVDLDHDGDLDLLLVGGIRARMYRNNLDGTFTDVSEAIGVAAVGATTDAAFADFDDDGRVDLLFVRSDGSVALLMNSEFQRFRDATAASNIVAAVGPNATIAVADYDNNGTFDFLVTGSGSVSLSRNAGNGAFRRDDRSLRLLQTLRVARSARFVDHDNDGWLDIVAVDDRGVTLLRNVGDGRFDDQSGLIAAPDSGGTGLAVVDADGDGDQDVFVAHPGGVRMLRNDGGNARLAMDVQLLALRSGGGKNNNFGIGSTIAVRAGELFQTRVVTDRVTHFGLGPHLKADVVRVQWTNGVPETIYFPGADADVLEREQLKGSCAFLYTWDGKGFRFVTDVMWRSALGMPLGIMAGGRAAAYAPAQASQEYLRIPGEALRARNGRYVLQLTEELWETAYLDRVQLIAVDHPDSMEVFVDERFVPPGPVSLRMFKAVQRRAPRSATDGRGNDLLAVVREKDDVYVSHLVPTQYQGVVEPHDLIMDLGADAGRDGSALYLRGWIYPTDASINVAISQHNTLNVSMPSLEVRDASGEWQVAMPSLGFPSGKDKTIVIDLTGIFPTADHRVRIRTNMRIHWDQVFVALDARGTDVRTTTLRPIAADLHFRGYSRMYRKGGRSGPHWFDYDSVSHESPWRTIEGAFTRFGDVRPLLQTTDDMYVIMAPGDEATVEFDASAAGSPPPGWRRTFLLYTDGWIKDADLNTAHGQSVEPLPFHAIASYPYAASDAYPADSAHARYRREYNTRIVNR